MIQAASRRDLKNTLRRSGYAASLFLWKKKFATHRLSG